MRLDATDRVIEARVLSLIACLRWLADRLEGAETTRQRIRRRLGSLAPQSAGGRARAAKLSAEQRSSIAKLAAEARWRGTS